MKILFGLEDVLSLDAWLDFFESKGYKVDGAMSGEDILGVADDFQPDILVCSYKLKGEIDGLGVYYSLCGIPKTFNVKLILIADLTAKERRDFSELSKNSGISGVIAQKELSFEAVEELL